MKIKLLLCLLVLAFGLSACETNKDTATSKDDSAATENKTEDSKSSGEKEGEKKEEFTGDVKFPFDFPKVETTAKSGEKVLVPSYNWLVEAMQENPDDVTMIWYAQTMEEPGEDMSTVKFMSETKKVPNAYIVPLPAGQTAKKGDILLTWWQTGSGLQRAIVTDAADGKAPTVHYLDIAYDNPAKSRDEKTTIGQMKEQIKPDTFAIIKNELEPGTAVAIGADMKHGQVIRAEGDKVFVKMFAGRVAVFPKEDVKAVPVKPNVKAGDEVKATKYGSFKDGKVSKVDAEMGRVWIKFGTDEKDTVVSFGDIMLK